MFGLKVFCITFGELSNGIHGFPYKWIWKSTFFKSQSEYCIIKLIPHDYSTCPSFGSADHPILIGNYDISQCTNKYIALGLLVHAQHTLGEDQCDMQTQQSAHKISTGE